MATPEVLINGYGKQFKGSALQLKDFKGPVLIKDSKFFDNYAPYFNCTEFETNYEIPNLVLDAKYFAMNTPFSPTSPIPLVYFQNSII